MRLGMTRIFFLGLVSLFGLGSSAQSSLPGSTTSSSIPLCVVGSKILLAGSDLLLASPENLTPRQIEEQEKLWLLWEWKWEFRRWSSIGGAGRNLTPSGTCMGRNGLTGAIGHGSGH